MKKITKLFSLFSMLLMLFMIASCDFITTDENFKFVVEPKEVYTNVDNIEEEYERIIVEKDDIEYTLNEIIANGGRVKGFNFTYAADNKEIVIYYDSAKLTYNYKVIMVAASVNLNKNVSYLCLGDSELLTATVNPDSARNKDITWESSDDSIVSVDNGTIKALNYGEATITVKTVEGEYTDICVVNVVKHVESVSLDKSDITMDINSTEVLTATVNPVGECDETIIWTSSDVDVITITDGVITAVGEGSATITATTVDGGFTATCNVTVNKLNPTVTGIEAISGLSYSGVNQVLITKGSTNAGTLKYAISETEPTDSEYKTVLPYAKNAGTYKVWYKVFGDNTYSDSIAQYVEVSIAKIGVDLPVANTSLTYNGSLQVGVNVSRSDKFTTTYNTAKNAGVHNAIVSLKDKVNYVWNGLDTSDDQTVTYTIEKANLDITGAKWNYVSEFTYNGKVKTVKVTGLPKNVSVNYVDNEKTNAGTYTAIANLVYDEENYNPISISNLTWTISKATYNMSNVKWDYTTELTYDGSEQIVEVVGLPSGVSVESYTDNAKTDAGIYTAKVVLSYDTVNYNSISVSDLEWTINKAAQTIVAPSATEENIKANSVTLTAISSGNGKTLYGYSLDNDSKNVVNWQEELLFESLEASTKYYFFAKYVGNENYNEVISTSKEITTTAAGNYLTFTAEDDFCPLIVSFASGEFKYSTSTDNGTTWSDWTDGNISSTTIILQNKGDMVRFKGLNCTTDESSHFSTFMGYISVSGSVTSLTDETGTDKNIQLTDGCYSYMFYNCDSIISSPELPSVNLAENCYRGMFFGCTSLKSVPELPATTLKIYCYREMFYNCIGITNAPSLPATTLAVGCYQQMFECCEHLTVAPVLNATDLAELCYANMFKYCKSLVNAPSLPATKMLYGCYKGMFDNCTSLVTAPALNATTLDVGCYNGMFGCCTSLVNAPNLPATKMAELCYAYMFYGCESLVNAPSISGTELAKQCYANMFNDCISLVNTPELQVQDLSDQCYREMFSGCTSLRITSVQPTTGTLGTDYGVIITGNKTIGSSSIDNMFAYCVKGSIDDTPTLGDGVTYYWTLGKVSQPDITAPSGIDDLVYNGTEQELVNAGSNTNGIWYYSLDGGEYTTAIPTAINAGTYSVKYKFVGDTAYEDITEETISVTIDKAEQTFIAQALDENIVYIVTIVGDYYGTVQYGYSLSSDVDTVTNWQDDNEFSGLSDNTYTFYAKASGNENYKEHYASYGGVICFIEGTEITMSDGSLKNIEDIVVGDYVLSYNHELAKFESQEVYYIYTGESKASYYTLHFTNGIELSIAGLHDLFCLETLKYTEITRSNAKSYIGYHFYNANNNSYEELVDVTYSTELVEYYSLYISYTKNCIAENMLSCPDDDAWGLNIYEFNSDLSIDHDVLLNDINEYGIFTDYESYGYSYEDYILMNLKYFNIALAKGYITYSDVDAAKEQYYK